MKLLVTGAGGQVGWELVRRGTARGHAVVGCERANLDITDAGQVEAVVARSGADLLVNAAAYTAVDKAEQEADVAFRINCDGPAFLAAACARHHLPLLHISTDYVFDGSAARPYREDDPVAPLGVYGASKEAGERRVRSLVREHLIVRTAWVYGAHGQNFVKTMLRLGREREELAVVADQVGCPTCAADLAEAIIEVAAKIVDGKVRRWGTYHCCGGGEASWYDFAAEIFAQARQRGEKLALRGLRPIATADYPTAAARPANSRLDCALLQRDYAIVMPHWRLSLAAMLDALPRG